MLHEKMLATRLHVHGQGPKCRRMVLSLEEGAHAPRKHLLVFVEVSLVTGRTAVKIVVVFLRFLEPRGVVDRTDGPATPDYFLFASEPRALNLELVVMGRVTGKSQRFDTGALLSQQRALVAVVIVVHFDIEAVAYVQRLQARAVLQDGCQPFVGEVVGYELQ